MQVVAAGRVRRDDSEWRELFARFRKRGQGTRSICGREKIEISLFHR